MKLTFLTLRSFQKKLLLNKLWFFQFPEPIWGNIERYFTVSYVYHFIHYTSCARLLQIFNSSVSRLNFKYDRSRTNLNRRVLVNIMCHNFNSICETFDISEISCSILNKTFQYPFKLFNILFLIIPPFHI